MEYGLSLGSNLGRRLDNLKTTKRKISEIARVAVVAQSSIYEAEPVGVVPQYRKKRFLNAILVIRSDLNPMEMYPMLQVVERDMGRLRTAERNLPRLIDIDIVYAGDRIMKSGGLTIPHLRWAERRFVLQPLADVRPDLVLPGESRTVRQVLYSLPESPRVAFFSAEW